MYKKIKTCLLYFCLSAVLLCGCSQTESAESTNVTEKAVQTSAGATVQTTSDTAVSAASSKKNLTEEQTQIQDLLSKTKQFFYDYVRGYEIQTHVDFGKTITQEVTLSDGKIYEIPLFEVVNGDVMTKTDLINKMDLIFTNEFYEKLLFELGGAHDYYFFDDDGKIYISGTVGGEGGLLGIDTTHISFVDESSEDTIVLNMTAFGSAERWGYDNDKIENFTITLKRTEEGLKIDKCDRDAQMYITYCYNPEDDIFS